MEHRAQRSTTTGEEVGVMSGPGRGWGGTLIARRKRRLAAVPHLVGMEKMMESQEMTERKNAVLRTIEEVPTQVYLGAALGSIGLSALTRLFGYKEAAVFFGQWPPTFLLLALAAKLLQPSDENAYDE